MLPLDYFSLSATFDKAAFAQTASLSPPGAPETAMAPITWSPTLIGTPPIAPPFTTSRREKVAQISQIIERGYAKLIIDSRELLGRVVLAGLSGQHP